MSVVQLPSKRETKDDNQDTRKDNEEEVMEAGQGGTDRSSITLYRICPKVQYG